VQVGMVLVWANPAAFTNHDGQGAAHHIPKCQVLGSPRAARQALGEGLRREVVQVQKDVVLVWANSAAFANLKGQVAAHHIPGRQALGRRSNPSHERFALPVSKNTSFATATLSE